MRKQIWTIGVAVLISLSLTAGGCGTKEGAPQKAENKVKENFKAAEVVKNLSEKEIISKINSYIEKNELDKAASVGEEGMKRYPDGVRIPLAVSLAYFYQEDFLDMIKVMRHAAEVSPNNGAVLNQLAWALVDSGENVKEGLAIAEKSMRALEQSGEPVTGAYLDTYGYALLKNGRFKEAVTVLDKAVLDTQSTEVNIHLALALEGAKDPKRAAQVWKTAQGLVETELKDVSNPPAQKRRLEKMKTEIARHLQTTTAQ